VFRLIEAAVRDIEQDLKRNRLTARPRDVRDEL
jgi:hypothetical protein